VGQSVEEALEWGAGEVAQAEGAEGSCRAATAAN
jgi:hypothetical protein